MAIELPSVQGVPRWFSQFLPWLREVLDRLDRSSVRTLTASGTLSVREATVLVNTTGGNVTVTLPRSYEATGRTYDIKKMVAANTMTIASADNIDGAASQSTSTQYDSFTVRSIGNTWIIV